MNDIHSQRCFHHPQREAAARCPECRRFYCRECVVDHETRILCADCLDRLVTARAAGRTRSGRGLMLRAFVGVILLWLLFYGMGRILLALPSSFHEGQVWRYPAEWSEP